jgi:TolA-binding protein
VDASGIAVASVDEAELEDGRGGTRQRGPAGQNPTLKHENMLFRRALAAEQEHDFAAAEGSLRRLLERYPSSPLAGEARRVLARVRTARGSSNLGQ